MREKARKLVSWPEKKHTNLQGSRTAYRDSVEIVDCQHGTSLVLVRDKRETFRFPRRLVSDQVHVHNFTKLREYRNHITLGEFIIQVSNENVGRIFVVVVVGTASSGQSEFEFSLVYSSDFFDDVHFVDFPRVTELLYWSHYQMQGVQKVQKEVEGSRRTARFASLRFRVPIELPDRAMFCTSDR